MHTVTRFRFSRLSFFIAPLQLPALVIGVPLGIWCYFSTARQGADFSLLNVIQTVPSVALFGLLIAPLAAGYGLSVAGEARHSRNRNDTRTDCAGALCLAAAGARRGSRFEPDPARCAGERQSDGDERAQRFLHVQLPLALPVFLRSLRVVMVQTVGMAVIAALIGAGGFGALVFQGLLSSAIDLVLLGVIPVIGFWRCLPTRCSICLSHC